MHAPSPNTVTAWIGLATTSRRLLERIERDLRAANLPPLSWYDALLEIERAGPDGLRPKALQNRLLLPQYGTSRLLDRLESAGLIARRPDPDDGRGHFVAITSDGNALRRRMWPVYARALRETVGAALHPSEAVELASILEKIRSSLTGT